MSDAPISRTASSASSEASSSAQSGTSSPPEPQSADPSVSNIITVYADRFSNAWPDNGIIKTYIFRRDPVLNSATGEVHTVGQLVMSYRSFIQTATFFNQVAQRLLAN